MPGGGIPGGAGGGAPDVSGGAVGGTTGGAAVGSVGTSAAPSTPSAASAGAGGGVAAGGATSAGVSTDIGIDTRAPGTDSVGSATSEASRAQSAGSVTGQAESTVSGTTEPATSARGKAEGAVNVDVSGSATGAATSRVDDLRDGAPQKPDPQAEARARFSTQDQAVTDAQQKRSDAERIGNDPRGAASARVEGEAVAGVNEVSPVDTGSAQAEVNVATGTVRDPAGAARGRADSAVESKKSEAKADVGIQADVNVSTTAKPDPTKK
ncbi:MAG: hypothetical protein ABI867_25580 [Kofleriaceae bacterium]